MRRGSMDWKARARRWEIRVEGALIRMMRRRKGVEEDELGGFGLEDEDEEEDDDEMDNARYEDFFGGKSKKAQRKPKVKDVSVEDASEEEDGHDRENEKEETHNLSTHENELLSMKAKTEQMGKTNLEPKTWTMQGEVTAATRPMTSALEVDLDFGHNARPAPVITEEVTASLEDLIRKRIMEIAPLAVSDTAAILAPEEVFTGKGNVKDEAELTRADRKRRAKKDT